MKNTNPILLAVSLSAAATAIVGGSILLIKHATDARSGLPDRRRNGNKFKGYCCEQCGAAYNSCKHAGLEDYTLIPKENFLKAA